MKIVLITPNGNCRILLTGVKGNVDFEISVELPGFQAFVGGTGYPNDETATEAAVRAMDRRIKEFYSTIDNTLLKLGEIQESMKAYRVEVQ